MAQCKSCGASIAWISLPGKDKPMPMDYVPIEVVSVATGEPNAFMGWSVGSLDRVHGRLITEAERLAGVRSTRTFRPHWSTCPHAEQHRRDAGIGVRGAGNGKDKPADAGGRMPVREVQGRLF